MQIGLIAGNGRFPFLVLDAARSLGHEVTVIAIREETDSLIEEAVKTGRPAKLHWVSLGQLGECIRFLQESGATKALMAGQVKHTKLFSGVVPDQTLFSVLRRLSTKNTDSLISAVAMVLEEHGIELIDSTSFLQPLLAKAGTLTRREPTDEEREDIKVGYRVADSLAKLDIGQTVIVKDRAVVAVEAMEGTDQAIKRAGSLAGPGMSVIKVSKPNQDMRFDVPVVGLRTIKVLHQAEARVLSIDAGRTLILDGDAAFQAANEFEISVIGRVISND